MKVFGHLLEYYSLLFIRQVVRYLPPSVVYDVGSFLGSFVYTVLRIRKDQVFKNLELAFPEKNKAWRESVAKGTYQQSAISMLEFMKLPEFNREYIDKHLTIEGTKNLDKALQNKKGVIIGGSHFGNWEYNGAVLPVLGYSTNYVMVDQHNLLVHALTNKYRMLKNIRCISRKTGTREIIRRLRKNELVCMLYDQDARNQGLFVDFFNYPASTHGGLALLAWKTGAAIVTCYMYREGKDRFHVVLDPPIWADPDMDREKAMKTITRKLNTRLEQMIRKHPAHWFWYHRRWKTKIIP